MVLNLNGEEALDNIIDNELDKAELMGFDTDDIDPELMGGIIANIAARIRAARERRKAGGTPSTGLSIATSDGTLSINDQGVSVLRPTTGGGIVQSGGILDQIKENPIMLAIPAAIAAILIMRSK